MDIFIFSSHPTQHKSPYLLLANQNDPKPKHPDGKTWTFWKTGKLSHSVIGVNPTNAAAGITADGYYLIP